MSKASPRVVYDAWAVFILGMGVWRSLEVGISNSTAHHPFKGGGC